MSGGHFDYKYSQILALADELKHEIDINDDTSIDEYGDTPGHKFKSDALRNLKIAQRLLSLIGELAKEVEWLYSGDTGEDAFISKIDEITEAFYSALQND